MKVFKQRMDQPKEVKDNGVQDLPVEILEMILMKTFWFLRGLKESTESADQEEVCSSTEDRRPRKHDCLSAQLSSIHVGPRAHSLHYARRSSSKVILLLLSLPFKKPGYPLCLLILISLMYPFRLLHVIARPRQSLQKSLVVARLLGPAIALLLMRLQKF